MKRRVQELLARVGLSPGALQPLPARVLGRPAPADRRRARDRAAAEADRLRRAGLGARRLGAGADPEPAQGPPEGLRPHLRLHLARPLGDPAGLGPDRRHVPRPRRRAERRPSRSTSIRATRTRRRSSRPCRGTARTAARSAQRQRIVLSGDVPSPVNPPAACVFHPRCPRFQHGHCDVETPLLRSVRAGSRGRLPLPGRALADDRGGAAQAVRRPRRRRARPS